MGTVGRLHKKIAVITGAGSGMGRGIALRFAEEGAVVVIPDINLAGAQETQRLIESQGGHSLALKVDVSNGSDVARMVERVISEYVTIDILVNNAGIQVRKPLLETSVEEWDRVLAVNLRSVFLCIKEVVPQMIKAGKGKIVNISSTGGLMGFVAPAYTASKGGIISLTRVLAGEFAPHRINVNTICPGFCATSMNEPVRRTALGETIRGKIPWGRWGTPADFAAMALFLASEEADYVTGAIIPVDGGLTSFVDLGGGLASFDKDRG
jgi:NAD(P)-dependent dehydrogenase (short-subunit alcohol dehydrogenase family)